MFPNNEDTDPVLRNIYEHVLVHNSEILLNAPPALRTVNIIFLHAGDYSLGLAKFLPGLSNWSRLDDALHRLEQAEVVCVMKAELVVADMPPFKPFDAMPELHAEPEESERLISLLEKMLPKTQASGRLKFRSTWDA
ncbi:hypothetical protein L226DRAFT_572844 [Lentinus tigrinus ALCF2SS1-7]|uniref:Uncharacterized protein n=1 Tax=Lentinus tigrinus ALCF2SS1-6 TaxID=1328759 RepID=A0A5C2S6C7_9APHY|nr:hypothetical protein L227DRAFT_612738 [Lentinus tigrinus ALCF2SS1-6]RPD72724.1 hypothetical protein L226DRAFT_572844 [Lentinus tigrinus ALCF2SS1-7]